MAVYARKRRSREKFGFSLFSLRISAIDHRLKPCFLTYPISARRPNTYLRLRHLCQHDIVRE